MIDETTETSELRSHAQMMLWDRHVGDELFRLASENASQGITVLKGNRVDAFKWFYDAWREGVSTTETAPFTDAALFAAMPPPDNLPQQISMLVDFSGFSLDQAALIVDVSETEARKALEIGRVQNRLDPARGYRAVLLEDEYLIGQELTTLLTEAGIQEVVLTRTPEAVLDAARQNLPDIVIADYRLGEGKVGTEIILPLREISEAPIGFVTAFPHDVLKDPELAPDFLIRKPFRQEAIAAAIGHWLGDWRE